MFHFWRQIQNATWTYKTWPYTTYFISQKHTWYMDIIIVYRKCNPYRVLGHKITNFCRWTKSDHKFTFLHKMTQVWSWIPNISGDFLHFKDKLSLRHIHLIKRKVILVNGNLFFFFLANSLALYKYIYMYIPAFVETCTSRFSL